MNTTNASPMTATSNNSNSNSTSHSSSNNNNNNNNNNKEEEDIHGQQDRSVSTHRRVGAAAATMKQSTFGKPASNNDTSTHNNTETVLDVIPPEYLYDPHAAEPSLHYLPKVVASAMSMGAQFSSTKGNNTQNNAAGKFPTLRMLLEAAQDDIRLHRARQQAGTHRLVDLLRSYKLETDPLWLARQQRLNERVLTLGKLDNQRTLILSELQAAISGLTAQEKTQVQLARWQRALELFVYAPPPKIVDEKAAVQPSSLPPTFGGKSASSSELDLWGLLEKLLEGISEVR